MPMPMPMPMPTSAPTPTPKKGRLINRKWLSHCLFKDNILEILIDRDSRKETTVRHHCSISGTALPQLTSSNTWKFRSNFSLPFILGNFPSRSLDNDQPSGHWLQPQEGEILEESLQIDFIWIRRIWRRNRWKCHPWTRSDYISSKAASALRVIFFIFP